MNKQQEEWIMWKKHFEENMLDGDSVEDCGRCLLSAEFVWEYISTSILPEIKSTEKDVAAEEENQKLPSELIEELSQQDFGGRIGIGTIMRAMDHLAKKNNWKI